MVRQEHHRNGFERPLALRAFYCLTKPSPAMGCGQKPSSVVGHDREEICSPALTPPSIPAHAGEPTDQLAWVQAPTLHLHLRLRS